MQSEFLERKNTEIMRRVTGAVLTGGKSSRMGTDKALLILEERTLLERSVEKLRQSFAEVVVIGNGKVWYRLPYTGVREFADEYSGCGPLGGIHAALKHAGTERVFVTACDLPFWEKELAELMIEESSGYEAAVPCIGCYFEPLLAVYTKACLPAIEENLNKGNFKVSDLYPQLRVNFVKRDLLDRVCCPETAFCNINTFEEYGKLSGIFNQRQICVRD
jgi:molybdopterin-guanine dinucleotide biosynthesis protein A